MNKAQLIGKIVENSEVELTKKQAEAALNATLESITDALVEGDKVQLVGFGTFETRERAARQGRNPKKPDEIIKIPATVAPVFKAGRTLKDSIKK